MDGMEIYNIHHEFDGIPESAFLIHVDGLWIYHAGDHGHSQGEGNKIFKDNIDYLASLCDDLDMMFTPTFGGEYYAIRSLSPRMIFPMHDGGHENQYGKFAQQVKSRGLKVRVGAAAKRGDVFFYKR
jgi:L-ascorbate metabolism protein UlaG (beta-lactamase superfamily)